MSTSVISIGGSILISKRGIESGYIQKLSTLLKKLSTDHDLFVVVGGGRVAREYIRSGRKLGADESSLDDIGVGVTRLNARLLIAAIGREKCYPVPAENFDEAVNASASYPVVVMGGTHAGHTTDAVAVMLAERVSADRFINATIVDGVYTADPKKSRGAKKLDSVTFDQLIEITSHGSGGAGPHMVIDPLASKLIARSKIPAMVLNGKKLIELEKAIKGKEFFGTVVQG